MPIAPTPLAAVPAVPDSSNDEATFDAQWEAFNAHLKNELQPGLNLLATNVYNNAVDAVNAVNSAMAAGLANAASNAAAASNHATNAGTSATAAANSANSAATSAAAAANSAASLVLPVIAPGDVGKPMIVNPSATGWILGTLSATLIRAARTTNTALTQADIGKLIDITSGTFTQTFDAAAALGNGWWCYCRNSGTGDITLDPAGAETIDGLAGYVMYPGEMRLIQCNGAALTSFVLNSFYRVFAASATFTKPPGYQRFGGHLWGGGSGGYSGYGGNGGTCVPFDLPATAIAATESVVIGAGGAVGANGGNTTFAGISSGAIGKGNTSGTTAYGRDPLAGPVPPVRFALANPGYGDYGGGKGSSTAGAPAGYEHSIYGGGGGVASGTGGTSVFGGAGGVGAGNGLAPGGGGGPTGAGARGELRIGGVL